MMDSVEHPHTVEKRRTAPTIRAVARAAGVSIATVSYVLNGRDLVDDRIRITADTRERVVKAADRLGYQANGMARAVRRGRTDQVCLALDFLRSPWTQAMVEAVNSAVGPLGFTTLLLVGRDWHRFLAARGADAAVIHGENLSTRDLTQLSRLGAAGVPVIALHCPADPAEFDVVRVSRQPAFDQVAAMITGRHERIGCIRRAGLDDSNDSHYAGYVQALASWGRVMDPALVCTVPPDRYRAYRAALTLLTRADRPTAVLATSDETAVSVLWAARRLGLDVPDELEIVGIGNTPESRLTDPPLTTIGARSLFTDVAGLLVARLQGSVEPRDRVHHSDWSLFARGTTSISVGLTPTSSGKESPS